MDSELPSKFDLVVIGTGIIESIVSAAASRIGKNVLQLDSNDFYGGLWASFDLKTLHNYKPIKRTNNCSDKDYLPIGNEAFDIQNFHSEWHVPEKQSLEPNLELAESHTQNGLLELSRKFNIDLAPKLHYARGDFINLLISSNIARYVEYRSVSRVLTVLNGQLELVPCSRSDVFANSKVTVIEKRMLMKLLTSLDEIEKEIEHDQMEKTFHEFLMDKKLSAKLIHYVLFAISRSTRETSLREGVDNTKRFLNSLGRFGKTPFLFSMYGSGETTQAFCRLSAVFGGTFALNQSELTMLKMDNDRVSILSNGGRAIEAEHFVLSAEYLPKALVRDDEISAKRISRAVFVTDKSIMSSELEHLTLLTCPRGEGPGLITLIEMGALTGTCPKGFFLVHLICEESESPRHDFEDIVNDLFAIGATDSQTKPAILWSCYFSLPRLNEFAGLPENLHVCDPPDLDLDYDSSIGKAKIIFHKMYPDLEFLPRAPDPEEIIIGDDTVIEEEKATKDSEISSNS